MIWVLIRNPSNEYPYVILRQTINYHQIPTLSVSLIRNLIFVLQQQDFHVKFIKGLN